MSNATRVATYRAKQLSLRTAQAKRVEELEAALRRIESWEMPVTGEFWDKDPSRPMSYAALWGSNGERDVIRAIAKQALEGSPKP